MSQVQAKPARVTSVSTTKGHLGAIIGCVHVAAGTDHVEVLTYISLVDGAIVAEVDTPSGSAVPVRVYVNDGAVFDELVK